MAEITDEVRNIAVQWVDNFHSTGGIQIEQKHKLASDIMNYAQSPESLQYWIKSPDMKEVLRNELINFSTWYNEHEITKPIKAKDIVNYLNSKKN